jgi:predicted membrane chloride channel (bestrophin family)
MMNASDESTMKNVEQPSKARIVMPTVKGLEKAARALPFIPSKAHEYTWEELETIERRRRDILPNAEKGFWNSLSHFDGTILNFLAKDTLFWFTVALYISVRMQARYSEIPSFVADLGNGNVATLGGFITFFLVLYVNKSHARYFDQYGLSMACKGRIFDVASLSITHLPKPTATRLVRYMNAAHVSAYVGLSKTYNKAFFLKLNRDFGMLTDRELERMNIIDLDKGGSCNRELIVWCLREIQQCRAAGLLDHELARDFRDQILGLRSSIGKIYNAADLPIPFFYVHFICLLTALYLPLFAVSAAYRAGTGGNVYWTADLIGGLVVVLQAIFVIGLRILGQKMSDPYGDDLVDLSVIFFVTFTWTMSNRILEAEYVDVIAEEEEALKREQIPIGGAWEHQDDSVVVHV